MHQAPTPPEDFEYWEIEGINFLVGKFFRTRRVPPDIDLDDLIQEAYRHWAEKRGGYDSAAGASPRTFLERVISHRMISLGREWDAEKRGGGEAPLSLDIPVGADVDGAVLGNLIEAKAEATPELRMDLQRALARLTPRQLLVLQGTQEELTTVEIAHQLGVHRDTVTEERKRIRQVLTDSGLRDYLR